MIKWNHIRERQPEHGRSIIQIDPPYLGHYTIGMRDYDQRCSWEEILKFCRDSDIPPPDFWWMHSEDFPFPDKSIS